jgi:hypothetical protein
MFLKYSVLVIYLFFVLVEIFVVVECTQYLLDIHFDTMILSIGTANKGVPIKIIFFGIYQTTIRVDLFFDSFFIIIDFFNFDK